MNAEIENNKTLDRYFYPLGEVFKGRLFQIPDYQRGYAWEQKQCQDLLDDLSMLDGDAQQHFFGTLILHDTGSISAFMDANQQLCRNYHVIDGQQRLTTSLIYLDLLHRELQPFDPNAAVQLKNNYVWIEDRTGFSNPRLILNRDTHAFFQQAVLESKPGLKRRIRSHARLIAAQQFFSEHLQQKREAYGENYPHWLSKQVRKITQQLTLIVYTVGTEPEAAVIFTAMNDRGKTISDLEKIKSHMLQIAHKVTVPTAYDLTDDVNKTWAHIFESLMQVDLGDRRQESRLLRAHWLMAYDVNLKNWKGAETIQTFFDWRKRGGEQQAQLLAGIRSYLASLREATTAFCDIYNPDSASAFDNYREQNCFTDIVRVSNQLIRVGSLATFLPLLIATRLRYPQDGLEYLETAELCERFSFRVYRWLAKRSNTGQSWLYGMGHKLYKGEGSIDGVQQELRQAIHHYCPDAKFTAQFDVMGNWYHWGGLRYFLYEYEHHLAQNQAVQMKWDYLIQNGNTIEHILPQTPDTDGYWTSRFEPEAYERHKHDIGNLTLTYDNSRLKNRSFNDLPHKEGKRGLYQKSPLFIERQIGESKDWDPEKVVARRNVLKAWALTRWQTPAPQIQSQPVELRPTQAGVSDYQQVLLRRSVPYGQRQLYKALYDAGTEGLTTESLIAIMGRRDNADLAGVLGALGRRINATPGYGQTAKPGIGMLITWERAENSQWRYFLRPQFRAILQEQNPPWLHEMQK